MPSLRCPRCRTVIALQAGVAPVCPGCGFTAPVPDSVAQEWAAPMVLPPAAAPEPDTWTPPAAPEPEPPLVSANAWTADAPGAAAATGTPGKVRSPGVVLLLTLVTLGIYGIVYWWKVSKEVDVYAGRRNAHPITRTGLILMLVALPLYFIAFLAIFAGASTGVSSDMLGGFFVALILAFASGALLLAGGICLLIGEWRVWSTIRDHEFAVSAPKPLSPGLQLFFVLMPWLNVVTHWVALYKTQNHLNAMWENRTV